MKLIRKSTLKVLVLLVLVGMVTSGCATPTAKERAYIHSALSIAQVAYPIAAGIAGVGFTSPYVMGAMAAYDESLDQLGKLTDVPAPGPAEVAKAQALLDKAQAAKVGLGVK